MKIIESILKRKKKEIVLLDNVNDVRVMAREIAEIEKSVKVLC